MLVMLDCDCFLTPACRSGYFGRGNLGEGGQRIYLEFSAEYTVSSKSAGSGSERGLSFDRSGCCAPHPGLPGLLRSCSGEQVYVAAGTSHHLHRQIISYTTSPHITPVLNTPLAKYVVLLFTHPALQTNSCPAYAPHITLY